MFNLDQALNAPMDPMQSAPSPMQPGGGPQQTGDPLEVNFAIVIQALKRFSADLKMSGDERTANIVDAMANKLTKEKLKRREEFERAMQRMQGAVIGAQM